MKQIIFYTILLALLSSCSINEKKEDSLPDKTSKHFNSTLRKVPNDSLSHYAYKTKNSEMVNHQKVFSTLEDFPNLWASMSKSKLGFFIYHRGNGLASTLEIENDTIKNHGYMETVSWPIREYRKVGDLKYYFGLGSDTSSGVYARCMFEIIDPDTMYSIQSVEVYKMSKEGEKLLGQYSGLYVPSYKQHLFYHIDEPNTKNPSALIQTEEIDLERFKREKLIARNPLGD